jgi:hypothetical protein
MIQLLIRGPGPITSLYNYSACKLVYRGFNHLLYYDMTVSAIVNSHGYKYAMMDV